MQVLLGGACTLIGTPTNIYANTALEEAGLKLFGMFDFAWVGIPIFILGGIYMIVMNRWCPSYEETVPSNSEIEAATEITPEMKKKQMVVGISFLLFVLALILDSLTDITVNPNFIGYALIAVSVLTTVVKPKEVITSFGVDMVLFCAGINLIIAVMKNSGLGEVFGAVVLSILGDTKKSVSDHSSIVPWIGNCNTVYEQYGNRRSTCPDWDLYCRINGSKPTGNCSCNCNWSRMLFPDTDRIRNKSDHDDLYKIEIPGFCKIWLAAADHLLDLLRLLGGQGLLCGKGRHKGRQGAVERIVHKLLAAAGGKLLPAHHRGHHPVHILKQPLFTQLAQHRIGGGLFPLENLLAQLHQLARGNGLVVPHQVGKPLLHLTDLHLTNTHKMTLLEKFMACKLISVYHTSPALSS